MCRLRAQGRNEKKGNVKLHVNQKATIQHSELRFHLSRLRIVCKIFFSQKSLCFPKRRPMHETTCVRALYLWIDTAVQPAASRTIYPWNTTIFNSHSLRWACLSPSFDLIEEVCSWPLQGPYDAARKTYSTRNAKTPAHASHNQFCPPHCRKHRES